MRLPKKPPNYSDVFNQIDPVKGVEHFRKIMSLVPTVNTYREYAHWEKFRFKPAISGLSVEESWAIVKFARLATVRYLPFDPVRPTEHKLHFTRPDCLLAILRRLDMQIGGNVATPSVQISPHDAKKHLQRSFLEEPFHSSILEGAVTTRERARELIDNNEKPQSVSDRMIVNNYQAMSFIKTHLKSPLTPEMIYELHRIITDGTLKRPEMAGKLRDNDDVVVSDDFGEEFHVPPTHSELEGRINLLCEFANAPFDNANIYYHPLVKAVILHFILAYDHPFIDGNGRTARALFYWCALRFGYWMLEYASISSVINEAQVQYGEAFLYTETDENDLTYFLMHQLGVVERAIERLQSYMARQRETYEKFEVSLKDENLNHRQVSVLNDLIRNGHKTVEISNHGNLNGISYLTARKDLEDLVGSKWLVKRTVGRKSIYAAGARLKE